MSVTSTLLILREFQTMPQVYNWPQKLKIANSSKFVQPIQNDATDAVTTRRRENDWVVEKTGKWLFLMTYVTVGHKIDNEAGVLQKWRQRVEILLCAP